MTTCLLDARRGKGDVALLAGEAADTVFPLFVEQAVLRGDLPRRRFLDDLIPTDSLHSLAERALACRDRFLELAAAGAGLEPDPLPLFQGDELLHLFREVLYGQRVAEALIEHGFDRIGLLLGEAADGSPTAATFSRAVEAALDTAGEGGRLQRSGGEIGASGGLRVLGRLDNLRRKLRNRVERLVVRPPRAGRCVAAFSSSQWKRFGGALADLRRHFGGDVACWYLGRLDASVRRGMAELGLPLSQVMLPLGVEPEVDTVFERRHRAWLDQGRHRLAEEMACPALAAPALEEVFALLFGFTFRRAGQWMRDLGRHLERHRPELVVGSAAFTYESALPLRVAEELDIPSLALSHSYVSGDHGLMPARHLACRNAFERQGYRHAVSDDRRVLYCHNASDTLSYDVLERPVPSGPERKRVALLTASALLGREVMPLHELGPWVRTLRDLLAPPVELAEIEWVFKFHPRFDVGRQLAASDLPANVRFYPATASVHDLLAESWLAVLVNHVGGVGIDARLAGLPLILLDSANYRYPRVRPESLEPVTVTGAEALWRLVGDLHRDGARYQALQDHNRAFVEHWLTPSDKSLAQRLAEGGEVP